MSAAVKYTLSRLGLFLAVLLVLSPVPNLSLFVKMLVALAASAGLSWLLLRRMRDQVAEEVAGRLERRKAEKAKLRAALAGDDQSTPDQQPATDQPAPGQGG